MKIVCKDSVTLKSEVVGEAVTGRRGKYRVAFKGDWQDQQCLAVLVNSPISNCQFPDPSRNTATVILTRSNGIASTRHFTNAMGFFWDQPLCGCATLHKHYLSDGDYRAIWVIWLALCSCNKNKMLIFFFRNTLVESLDTYKKLYKINLQF